MAPAAPAGLRSIRVVLDDNYPPLVFRDNDGQLQGLLVDEWRLWESRTGIKVELHAIDWNQALRRMRAGEFEVIDTVFKTPERAAYWDFSKPYARIEVPIFFRKDIADIMLERPQTCHSDRLGHPHLALPQRLFGSLPLRNVLHRPDHAPGTPRRIPHHESAVQVVRQELRLEEVDAGALLRGILQMSKFTLPWFSQGTTLCHNQRG